MLVLGKLLLFCFCLNIIDFSGFSSVEFLSVWFLTSDGNKTPIPEQPKAL